MNSNQRNDDHDICRAAANVESMQMSSLNGYSPVEEIALTAAKQDQDIPKTYDDDAIKDCPAGTVVEEQLSPAPQLPEVQPATPASSSQRQFPEELLPWSNTVSMPHVMDALTLLLQNHCVLTEEEIDAIALWTLSSYMIDSFRIFPKLALISPVKRCGKTTTMEAIFAFCKDGLMTANLSPAILYRLTASFSPTLLIDEADTFVKSADPALIGIINSGHSKSSAIVMRCVGENFEPKAFSTWMPMVLASIKNLPPTIMDRSIVINLRRKKNSEHVSRLSPNFFEDCKEIRRKLLRWTTDNHQLVEQAIVEPPYAGNDRATDNWLALFSVAYQIDATWQARCERAYLALTVAHEPELPEELLRDIQEYFLHSTLQKVSSQTVVDALLAQPDSTWKELDNGKKLNPRSMSALLSPYKIKPAVMRFPGGKTFRGYERIHFEDAFDRYLI